MNGVGEAVKQDHGDGFDALLRQCFAERLDRSRVRRHHDVARRVDSLVDLERERPRNEGGRTAGSRVIEVRAHLGADQQHVAETAGRHEGGAGTPAFQDGIGRDGRAVGESGDFGARCVGVLERAPRGRGHAKRLVRRCRQDLGEGRPPALRLDEAQIGERPSDVTTDAMIHGVTRMTARWRTGRARANRRSA